MQPGWALALSVAGVVCNMAGLVLGWRALIAAWRAYASEPLLPWLWDGIGAARLTAQTLVSRLTGRKSGTADFTVRASFSASGVAASASGAAGSAGLRVGFTEGMTDSERIHVLQHAVEGIYDQFFESQGVANRRHEQLSADLARLASHVDQESERLNAQDERLADLSKEIAVGDVRVQLAALLLVGIGTLLGAIPTIWALVAAGP